MSMPGFFRKLYKRALPGAFALLLAVSPVTGLTAYASNGGDGGDAPSGTAVHKYVISNKNSDPDYRHDENCRQDIYGVSVGPGDADWPDQVYDTELDGEFRGHSDTLCYKTFIDDPTLERPENDPPVQDPEDGDTEQPPEKDESGHGPDCMHKHDLTCKDETDGHEHDESCYGPGNVDKNGWEHNEDCIKMPYKPSIDSMDILESAGASSDAPPEQVPPAGPDQEDNGGLIVNATGVPYDKWPTIGTSGEWPSGMSVFDVARGDNITFTPDFSGYNWAYIVDNNVVVHGAAQPRESGIDSLYVENHFATKSGYVDEEFDKNDSRHFWHGEDGSLHIPMKVEYVMRGGYAARGVSVLNINVGFYNEHEKADNDRFTTLFGTKYDKGSGTDISNAIDVQIVPRNISLDGGPEEDVPSGMKPLWIKASVDCSGQGVLCYDQGLASEAKVTANDFGWLDVVDEGTTWTTMAFKYDLVLYPKDGNSFETYGSDRNIVNTVSLAPINYYGVVPGDKALDAGHAAADVDNGDVFGDKGIGRATVTSVFCPVNEMDFNVNEYAWQSNPAYGRSFPGFYNDGGTRIPFSDARYPWNYAYAMTCSWNPVTTGDPDVDAVSLNMNLMNTSAVDVDSAMPSVQWTVEACRLDFNGNGGTVAGGDFGAEDGTVRSMYHKPAVTTADSGLDRSFDTSAMSAERAGYEFIGWSWDEAGEKMLDGSSAVLADGAYEGTLFAQWFRVDYGSIPSTGGAGTAMLLSIGILGLLAACAALFASRRRDA